jgi:hypothetical protein
LHTAAVMASTIRTGSDHPGVDRRVIFAPGPEQCSAVRGWPHWVAGVFRECAGSLVDPGSGRITSM